LFDRGCEYAGDDRHRVATRTPEAWCPHPDYRSYCDGDKSIAACAGSLGAAAFLQKPLPRDALLAAINSAKKREYMHTPDDFDPAGVVVDWLDACRAGHLDALLNLYEERATLRCDCDDVDLAGLNSLATYWKSKLESKAASAFTLDDMILTGDQIQVECQGCKGRPVRIEFRFSPLGKILHTRFGPLGLKRAAG